MRREPHVRFCERTAVRFHRATHPVVGFLVILPNSSQSLIPAACTDW